jgi:hypothetical protein
MPRRRPILRFLAAFALVYGVLIAPWPGWNAAYGAGFRRMAQACLGASEPTAVRFQATPGGGPLDMEIVVFNPTQADAQGRVKTRLLRLDTRGVGWIPTAFLVALVIASPVTWCRRLRALALGLVALDLYLLLAVRVYIWNATLSNAPETLKAIASGLVETMVVQLGPSFVVPAILWLLVTFRQADFEAALGRIPLDNRNAKREP